MSKCPKCAAEIEHLTNYYLHWTEARFSLENNEGGFKREYDSICMSANLKDEYNCPACDSILFTKQEEAVAFLKGVAVETKQKDKPENAGQEHSDQLPAGSGN